MDTWHRATMKLPLLSLARGDVVAVIQTELRHTNIGPTYWILCFKKHCMYQISENAYGKRLNQLLRIERPVREESIGRCIQLANQLIETSQYSKERRNEVKKILPVHIKRK